MCRSMRALAAAAMATVRKAEMRENMAEERKEEDGFWGRRRRIYVVGGDLSRKGNDPHWNDWHTSR